MQPIFNLGSIFVIIEKKVNGTEEKMRFIIQLVSDVTGIISKRRIVLKYTEK